MTIAGSFPLAIRFTYEGGARGERRHPFQIPWRQLPGGQIERPEGSSWILEIEGQSPITVHSGEVMVIPRGIRHRLRMAGARIMHTAWIMACFDGLAGMDLLATAQISPILPRSAGDRLSKLMTAARELNEVVGQGDLAALARLHAVGFRILEILLEYAQIRRLTPIDPELDRLLPVLQHVEANPEKPVSIRDLARQVYLSPSRFYSVFKRVMGVTPMAHVQNARLRLAQRLLIASSRPVGEVAVLAGFASPYYFSRAFRRHFKTTPTAFRRDPNWFRATVS